MAKKVTRNSLKSFLNSKGWLSKIASKKMTEELWLEADVAIKAEFGVGLNEAIQAAQKLPVIEAESQAAIEALFGPSAETDGNTGAEANANADSDADADADADIEANADATAGVNVSVPQGILDLQAKVKALEAQADQVVPAIISGGMGKVIMLGGAHNKTHMFGKTGEFFSRDKWWNEMAVSKTTVVAKRRSPEQEAEFKAEFDKYGERLSQRVVELHEMGALGAPDVLAAIDYSDFDGTGWGNEYVVRRMDAIIAYIRSLPSVTDIFPVRYGVQHKEVMTKSFLGEFSQAWQTGHVFKGSYKLQPAEAIVNDLHFKHLFDALKNLEKEYLGYLNREGSDPMKWTFIEWLMVQTVKVLTNEKNSRRISGTRVEPVTSAGWENPYLFGSDGVLKRLRSYVDAFELKTHSDYGIYTEGTVLTVVEGFTKDVNALIPSIRGNYLYMNEKHVPWYMAAYESKYGTKLDYTGAKLSVKFFDLDGIIGVPNMGNENYLMWITGPGNVELIENLVGEMEKLYFQRDLEALIVASWWAEGSLAYLTGEKFDTQILLDANNYKNQFIFLTDPYVGVAADATTIDGSKGDRHKTVENTVATEILDVTSAQLGIIYRIVCGHLTNASVITKALKFSTISDDWTPTAIGDWIEVYLGPDSKFYELARVVT